jgi:hypothetical protein
MLAETFTDPREHLDAALAFLLQDRVFNMHQLRFMTRAAAESETGQIKSEYLWGHIVRDGASVVASALCTSRAGIFISPHDTAYTRELIAGFPSTSPVQHIIAERETAWRGGWD